MKILYVVIGYFLGFVAVYIAGMATGSLNTTITSSNGQVSFISHPLVYLFFIPALLLFGIGIFSISKGVDV